MNGMMTIKPRPPQPSGLEENYAELAMAVVRQALKDYESILIRLPSASPASARPLNYEKARIESFFHSEWYGMLCSLDGETLLRQVRLQAARAIREQEEKRQKKLMKGQVSI